MVAICQQCGDKGFSNALVYCVKCLNFAVHRYCLHQLPETFEEFVIWVCEDCKQKATNRSPLHKPSSTPFHKLFHRSPKLVEAVHCKTKSNKKRDATCLAAEKNEDRCHDPPSQQFPEAPTTPSHEHPQVKGDCSPIKVALKNTNGIIGSKPEADKLRDQSNPSQQPNEANRKPKKKRKSITMKRRKKKKVVSSVAKTEEQRLESDLSHQRHEARTKTDPTEHAELASDFSRVKENSKQKKDGACSVEETGEQKRENCASEQICVMNTTHDIITMDVVPVGDYPPINEETACIPLCIEKCEKELELEKERRLVLSNGGSVDHEVSRLDNGEYYLPLSYLGHAKPVIDSIWRGNFSIANKKYDTVDGFVAHLSSKACSKVWEEASLLPRSLCMDMLPKADVWPKSFRVSQPSDDNIALYFFPADKSYERVFDHLVEDLMCKELALRTTVRNAELLVFASMELPLQHWRFQGKYYLWGVFRGKQASQSQLANQLPTIDVGTREEQSLAKTKIRDARSPLSPLSNSVSGEHESAMDQESEDFEKSEKSA